jgi:hypothetical protein
VIRYDSNASRLRREQNQIRRIDIRRAAHYRAGNAALRPISRQLPHGRPVKPVNAVKNSSGRL